MRIRTIKPEFWRSRDISDLNIEDRFLFIGLWSYVDDNGVGVYDVAIIAAELFAHDLSRDSRETLARVSRGLQTLSDRGLITLYSDVKRDLLHINTWKSHQRIDRPAKAKYPLPDAVRETLATPSRDPRETPSTGTEEPRNRGTRGIDINPQHADAVEEDPTDTTSTEPTKPAPQPTPTRFAEFWNHYPRKVGKRAAETAYRNATKRADESTILEGVKRYAADPNLPDPKFIPHAATWLNRDGWLDEPEPAAATGTDAHRFMSMTERKLHTTMQAGLAWAAEEQPSLDDTTPLQLTYEDNQQ